MGAGRPSQEWQQRRAAAQAANSAPLSLFNTAHPLQFDARTPEPSSRILANPPAAAIGTPPLPDTAGVTNAVQQDTPDSAEEVSCTPAAAMVCCHRLSEAGEASEQHVHKQAGGDGRGSAIDMGEEVRTASAVPLPHVVHIA